jgi:UDP:flavonoid glycosyltransferase YjiC (YdhE family)
MRVLLTSLPSSGHWHPLVPFAAALHGAGHEVAFATAPSTCAAIAALGYHCFPVGTDETPADAQERHQRAALLADEGVRRMCLGG